MNRTLLSLFVVLLINQKTAFSDTFESKDIQIYILNKKVAEMEEKVAYFRRYKDTLDAVKTVSEYFWELGNTESSCNYNSVNSLGYLGKYQFGIQTLRTIGIDCTPQEFLNNPLLQEKAIIKLNIENYQLLKNKTNLKTIKFGYLAAAHLGGVGNVLKYIKNKYNPKDAYGTSIENYLNKFAKYKL